jgi:hypothetical protein
VAAEADARENRRGLWADPNPVSPWEWQREKRRGEETVTRWSLLINRLGRFDQSLPTSRSLTLDTASAPDETKAGFHG